MDTSYAPAEFLAEDGKTLVGFDVDIAKAVQAALQKLMDDGTYMKILKHWGRGDRSGRQSRNQSDRPRLNDQT